MNVSSILRRGRLRPKHFDDGIAIFTGEPENEIVVPVDMTAAKLAVMSAQSTIVDDFEAAVDILIGNAKIAKDGTVDSFDAIVDNLLSNSIVDINNYIDANSTDDTLNITTTALKAQIAILINAIAPDYTALKNGLDADIDLVNPDYTGLKDDLEEAVDTGLNDINTDVEVTEVFATARDILITAIETHEENGNVKYPYPCVRCKRIGRFAANQESNANPEDTTQIVCPSCDQLTVTEIDNTPKGISWPAVNVIP